MFADDQSGCASEQWWLATVGNLLVWARLRVRESGIAEILDGDGRTDVYDSEDSAQAALLDADFRAYDGLDGDDADALGFDLDAISPPDGIEGADVDELRTLMSQRLPSRQ
ncbi:MAG: hypothetical protein JSS44_04105 [Proteobacteria bacterium]|nr:hypothetical protein [Pseudomonadota bacterium]MBS0464665.1 hypothetical protein [Pseudomonadota bacterium]